MQINWTRLLSNTNTVHMWNFYEFKSHKLQIAQVLTTIICLKMASKGAEKVMWPKPTPAGQQNHLFWVQKAQRV